MIKSYHLDYEKQIAHLIIECMMLCIWYGCSPSGGKIMDWIKATCSDKRAADLLEAMYLIKLHDYATAEEILRSALLRDKGDSELSAVLALVLFENGKAGVSPLLATSAGASDKLENVGGIIAYINAKRGPDGFQPERTKVITV